MEHTPTPWRVSRANPSPTTGEWMIAGSSNGYLAEVRDCGGGSVAANARRIVACINACAGLDTEQLEKFGLGTAFGTALFDVTAQRDQLQQQLTTERASLFAENQRKQQLEQQCEELLAVLESIIDLHDSASRGKQVAETIGKARAVITAVKGK